MSQGTEPIFYILVQPEGKTEADRIDATDTITSLEFEDDEKKADVLKLTVDNWDLSNFDNPVWKPGNTVIATWGYPGHMAPQRECIIQKVSGSTVITVESQSKAVLMNKVTKTKTYENTTRSEIVIALAQENGYGLDRIDVDETEEVYESITQARMTDAQFIKSLADKEHFEFYVDFDGLHWHARRMGQKPLRVLQYYLAPDVGDVLSFNVENDIFAKPGQVLTKGRDPLKKQDVSGEGSNAKTERDALNPLTEIVDPQTGQTTLRQNAASSDVKPTTETSSAQAKKEADGSFKRSVQTTVKLEIDMVGDPGVVAKSVVDVRGISKRLSGLYYVNNAKHTIDSSGYKLKLKCTTDGTHGHSENLLASSGPGAGGAPTSASLAACKSQLAAKKEELVRAVLRDEVDRLTKEYNLMAARCAAIEASVSKAKVNDGKSETKDPGALTQVEKVDPTTGGTAVSYVDTHGREKGDKK
jgi:phage protein D